MLPILWEVRDGVAGIEVARLQQPSSAGETAPLMTNRRQFDAAGMGCIPNMLIGGNRQFAYRTTRKMQRHAIRVFAAHSSLEAMGC